MPNQNSHITNNVKLFLPEIIELLQDYNLSLKEACNKLDLSYASAYNQLKKTEHSFLLSQKNNGKSKTSQTANSSRSKIDLFEKNNVEKLYLIDQKTLKEIGVIYNTTAATVMKFCRKNNIPVRTNSEAGKLKYMKDPSLKEKQRNLVYSGITGYPQNKKRESWIESLFKEWLIESNITFDQEFRINGFGHSYDFRVGNTIVELDGVYWHSTEKQKIKDRLFEEKAIENGFTVIRLTDTDIKAYGKSLFDQVVLPQLKVNSYD